MTSIQRWNPEPPHWIQKGARVRIEVRPPGDRIVAGENALAPHDQSVRDMATWRNATRMVAASQAASSFRSVLRIGRKPRQLGHEPAIVHLERGLDDLADV